MRDGFQLGRAGETGYWQAGDGPPLVFIHGVGMHAGFWAPQLAAFAQHYTVLAYDTLGHGSSALPPARPTLTDYSSQLRDLLDARGLRRIHLVGHSMGALIALDFALTYPDRVAAVVPMNGVYCRSEAQAAAVARRAGLLAEGAGDMAWRQAAIDRWFGKPVPAPLLETAAWVGSALSAVNAVGYARAYDLFASADRAHAGRLGALAMPALFLTGAEDENSAPAMSRQMAAEAPQGRAVILPAQRHMMSLAAPGVVNAALADFLIEAEQNQTFV